MWNTTAGQTSHYDEVSMQDVGCETRFNHFARRRPQYTGEVEFDGRYKEEYIDENGGDIILEDAAVTAHIPKEALSERTLLSLEIKSKLDGPSIHFRPLTSLTPIVTCKSYGQNPKKPVRLTIPHCGVGAIKMDKVAVLLNNEEVNQREGNPDINNNVRCDIVGNGFFHVYTSHLGDVEVVVEKTQMKKRIRIVPSIREHSSTLFVLRVWLINDLKSESMILNHWMDALNFVPFANSGTINLDNGECFLQVDRQFFMNQNDEGMAGLKKLNNKALFYKCRHCFVFQIEKNDAREVMKSITVKVMHQRFPKPICVLRKDMQDSMQPALVSDLTKRKKDGINITHALICAQQLSNTLMEWPLQSLSQDHVFPPTVISRLKETAKQVEKGKNTKGYAVIVGSFSSMAGGALSVAGAVLTPLTFGASIGLLATGLTISFAGSAVSIGFAIKQIIQKNLKQKKIEEDLNKFVQFQTQLIDSLTNIMTFKDGVYKAQIGLSFNDRETYLLDNLQAIRDNIKKHEASKECDYENLTEIVSQIKSQSEQLIEILKTIHHTFNVKLIGTDPDPLKTISGFVHVINAYGLTEEGDKDFIMFVKDYLEVKKKPIKDIALSTAMGVESGGNAALRSTALGFRVAARASLDASDNIAQAGGQALKVVKGFATAGIILGALGIVVDAGFVGHAVYDIWKKDQFAVGLLAIVDLMEVINDWPSLVT